MNQIINGSYDDNFDTDWVVSNALSALESISVGQLSIEYQDRLFDLSNKVARERMKRGQQIGGLADSKKAIGELLQMKQEEVMSVLFLDCRHRLISYEELFHGSVGSALVYTRVLVKRALAHNSSSIILAHNHPSGNPEPSQADKDITQRIKEAMSLIEVSLLDHLVVGVEGIYSFAERGDI